MLSVKRDGESGITVGQGGKDDKEYRVVLWDNNDVERIPASEFAKLDTEEIK